MEVLLLYGENLIDLTLHFMQFNFTVNTVKRSLLR